MQVEGGKQLYKVVYWSSHAHVTRMSSPSRTRVPSPIIYTHTIIMHLNISEKGKKVFWCPLSNSGPGTCVGNKQNVVPHHSPSPHRNMVDWEISLSYYHRRIFGLFPSFKPCGFLSSQTLDLLPLVLRQFSLQPIKNSSAHYLFCNLHAVVSLATETFSRFMKFWKLKWGK